MHPTDHHLGQIMAARVIDDHLRRFLAGQRCGLGAKFLRQPEGAQDALALGFRQALQLGRLDINGMPFDPQLAGDAAGATHDFFRPWIGADAHQQGFARLPHRCYGFVAPVGAHLVVHPVGGLAQGEFA